MKGFWRRLKMRKGVDKPVFVVVTIVLGILILSLWYGIASEQIDLGVQKLKSVGDSLG